MVLGSGALRAEEQVFIGYCAPDWGPPPECMTNAALTTNSSMEVIYFLKRIIRIKPASGKKEIKSGADAVKTGYRVALCAMNPDGSNKREIKTLWENPSAEINMELPDTVWLDVCPATRKMVLSIVYAGNEMTGLHTMDLDGANFRRIRPPVEARINHANWSPDGRWIVFDELPRGKEMCKDERIMRCDTAGSNVTCVVPDMAGMREPSYSPDGEKLLFTGPGMNSTLWIMDSAGTNRWRLPKDKSGRWWGGGSLRWVFDSNHVYGLDMGVLDLTTAKMVRRPDTLALCRGHWGEKGFVGVWSDGIRFIPAEQMRTDIPRPRDATRQTIEAICGKTMSLLLQSSYNEGLRTITKGQMEATTW
jgi:hypothetical protein